MSVQPKDIEHFFNNLSQLPERRARLEVESLEARLAEIRSHAVALVNRPEALAIDAETVEGLCARHERATRAYWAAEGRCASWFVTGPANFPVERNRKRMDTAHKRMTEVGAHLQAAKRRLERIAFPHGLGGAIRSADPDALDKLRAELVETEQRHEWAKLANGILRQHGRDARPHLEAAGLPEKMVASALVCDSSGRPFGFFTNNSNAKINRIKDRIAGLERMRARGTVEKEAPDGVRLVENATAARVQLIFPGKPDAATRTLLKSHGFRWAPSEGAWQRHLNNAGRWAAQRVVEALGGAASPPPAPAAAAVGERWRGTGPRVTAMFETDDAANAYMAAHPGQGVLAVEAGRVLVADCADLGAP